MNNRERILTILKGEQPDQVPWFGDLACASDDSLAGMYRDSCLQLDSETLLHLNTLLSEAESTPVNWQNYLRNGIRQLNADMELASREDFPVKGFPNSMERDELITFWRGLWSDFSTALGAWPEIRKTAAVITEAEVTP